MENIKSDKQNEKVLAEAKFHVPKLLRILRNLSFIFGIMFLVLTILVFTIYFINISNIESSSAHDFAMQAPLFMFLGSLFSILTEIFIAFNVVGSISFYKIKKCSCKITNKRIVGVTTKFLTQRQYSYRLDQIVNVEMTTFLKTNALSIIYTSGSGTNNSFIVPYVLNANEIYEILSQLIVSTKNKSDMFIDVEEEKVEVMNKQATSIEKLSNDINLATNNQTKSGFSYIEEIKQLHALKDQGIISNEEFETKKSEILSRKQL